MQVFCFVINYLKKQDGLKKKIKYGKKELKPLEMKQKIKDMNFLPEITVQFIASQANLQEVNTYDTNNENTTGNKMQITSGITVAIQVHFQEIKTKIYILQIVK